MVDRKHARRLNNSQSNPTIKYYKRKKKRVRVQQRVCVCSDQWHGCNRGSRLRKCTRASLVLVFVLRLRAIHHPMLLYRE